MRARSKSMSVVGFAEALFGALLRRLRAGEVDLVGLLGDLREDRDAIRLDFREAKRDQEVVLLLALAVPQRRPPDSVVSRGRVTGQDAEDSRPRRESPPRRPVSLTSNRSADTISS